MEITRANIMAGAIAQPQQPTISGRVLELGGDLVNPHFRPNINAVPGPGVDIVADLNEGIPAEDAGYDTVYGSYVIEHIRHARVRTFIAELYRVLKSGGQTVMVTANLLEQCRRLVEAPQWSDDLLYMLFAGSPDYPGNYHHTGFSPEWAKRLFAEAGFAEVLTQPHPNCATDMVIMAKKATA